MDMPFSYLVLLIVVGALAVVVVASLIWRGLSTRYHLPCPVWMQGLLDNPLTEQIAGVEKIARLVDIRPGMYVLDVGCGPGRLTIPLAKVVGDSGEVWGVDIQDEMLDIARQKADREQVKNVHLVHMAIDQGQLPGEKFDRAIMITVLGEIPDKQSALREIYHSLKPGGILSITELILDPHFTSQAKAAGLMQAAGFRTEVVSQNLYSFTMNATKE
jgi:ubiquinone/menaquinone biosynthesis C-methylase UbiE